MKIIKLFNKKYFCVIISFIIILFLYAIIYNNINYNSDKIANGVIVGNVDVSGMTKKQAEYVINDHIEKLKLIPMIFIVDDNKIDIQLSLLGFRIKDSTVKLLVNQAYDYGKKGFLFTRLYKYYKAKTDNFRINISYCIDVTTSLSILEQKIPAFKDSPKNAKINIENGKIKIIKEQEGFVIDKYATINLINNLLDNDWNEKIHIIKVPNKKEKPHIFASDIKDVKDKLGSFTTTYNINSDNAVNIECGAQYINGTLVLPYEEVSVNSLMAPYTIERGYREADSYANGKIVKTIGGGICQCSTTLYNALLYSEIQITKRFAHSMPIRYVPYGRDAAIASTNNYAIKDLCFKNNTNYPIYIYANAKNGYITFIIYGKEYRASNRTVDYTHNVVSDEVVDVADNNYISQDNQFEKCKKIRKLTVVLLKHIYVNNIKQSSEQITKSIYLVPKNT